MQPIPLLTAAFPRAGVSPLVVNLPVLLGNIAWRQREQQDVGVLAVRCLVCSKVFGRRTITLQRLLKCREPSGRGAPGLLGRELLLPQFHNEVCEVREQLQPQAFCELVEASLQDPERQPFAFVGPGNRAADGWLVLRQAKYNADGTVGPGQPFIIYTASKQRRVVKKESVSAADIKKEMQKDLISTTYDFVYVYITDQAVEAVPQDDGIVVISPQEHEVFYGCCAQLLKLSRM